MVVGESKRFDYTGNVQEITLEKGMYILEAYGAYGGGSSVGNYKTGY